MLQNIFETVIKGSNTVFLNIPEDDYFFSYNNMDTASAKDVTSNYFIMKGKDGIPQVKEIEHIPETHMVKITLDVEMERNNKIESYITPDIFNVNDGNV